MDKRLLGILSQLEKYYKDKHEANSKDHPVSGNRFAYWLTSTNSEDTTIAYTFLDKVAYKLIQDRSFEKETISFWDISEACKPHLIIPQERVADWASSRDIYGYFAPNISFTNLSYVLDILRKQLTA